ncbi:interferon-induced GTP-binding protein Mx1-like [Haliotis rufescens]|uniref:interferon-induced GTP-binding protein Mx1-like n=1 Tax=Haliotis rufescens TaxID=6454 RepID=UPI00201EE2AF|nr:interferon-induced GTP-binding protein Mx1-like [Haliotis rufescens]
MGGNKKKNRYSIPTTPSPDNTELKTIVSPGERTKALASSFDAEVRPLIDLVDKLRGYGLDSDINLPAVAVIGDQSAGKSSVLEAISGVQLPRGTGIVTRCPLEMRMKHSEDEDMWEGKIMYKDMHGEAHEEIILNRESVGELVRKAQKEMTDSAKGISDELITLEVTSSDVPDLTVIDLPGIARNAVEGQPVDIEARIKQMIRKYIGRQETIILAVLQCNVDIATCEALKMAKEFDDEGGRTLGVLTKPDLLDKGAESGVVRILNNMEFTLSKGYIIVKCRGQEAISDGQSLKQALEVEEDFFKSHRHFSSLRPSQWGIPNLSTRLSRELKKHIKKLLPVLKEDVRNKLLETERKLYELGEDPPETASEKRQMALQMVTEFIKITTALTSGQRWDDSKFPPKINSLYSSARRSFVELSKTAAQKQPDIKNRILKNDLQERMECSRGREFCNFLGKFELVESYAREYISKLEAPALRCFDDVHRNTIDILKILAEKCFEKFPDFAQRAKEVIMKTKKATHDDCKGEIQKYFTMENLVYSQDDTYGSELRTEEEKKRKEEKEEEERRGKAGLSPVDKTEEDVNSVGKALLSLRSYCQIAARRLCDVIPMIIQQHVFREQVEEMRILLMDIASDERTMVHIQEDPDMAYTRRECKSRHERLQLAEEELDKI